VTFTAPGSGPSGTFAGALTTASATTGSNGVAIAPTFTAGSQTGSYTITAAVNGVTATASFQLTNTAVMGSGSLAGSGTSAATTANLTAEGITDWVHWGDAALNRKGATAELSTYSVVGQGGVNTYNNDPRPITWTDGSPTTSSANNTNGIYISGTGQGFSFTAPADTTKRTLMVHVGGYFSGGTLTALLSDGSAANYV